MTVRCYLKYMITISVVNRKGGVGKTTTVFNLSYILSKKGVKTLAVDFDPQASLTSILGFDPEELEIGIDVPILSEAGIPQDKVSLKDVIVKTNMDFDLAPSRDQLELANIILTSKIGRELVLKKKLNEVADDYDIAVIDCQTSISLLTINALAASDYVLIPVELAYLSMQGFNVLMNIILEVKQNVNPNLKILGILPTKYDSRLTTVKKAMSILDKLKEHYYIFPPVKKTVAFDKSVEEGKPVFLMDSKAAEDAGKAYEFVANKIIEVIKE